MIWRRADSVGGCGRGIIVNCPDSTLTTMPRSRSRSRSRSHDRHYELPKDVTQISESDYFLKSAEFRVWLKDEKGKVCKI